MGFIKEFKEFAMRGSVVDMAVGIIIGAAFGGIVSSLVNDVVMPPLGLVVSNVDFSSLEIVLKPNEAEPAKSVAIKYGVFLNKVINFLIIAFVVFVVIRQLNRLKQLEQKSPEPTTKACPYCQETISVKATRCPRCTSNLASQA
jgi:large conductance mechanosensitive channel